MRYEPWATFADTLADIRARALAGKPTPAPRPRQVVDAKPVPQPREWDAERVNSLLQRVGG